MDNSLTDQNYSTVTILKSWEWVGWTGFYGSTDDIPNSIVLCIGDEEKLIRISEFLI